MGELEQFETDEEVGLSYAAQAMADPPEMALVSGPKQKPDLAAAQRKLDEAREARWLDEMELKYRTQ